MSDAKAGPDHAGSNGEQLEPVYLAVCSIYRDEAPYLREWIELHRLVGVERFFLYNNNSTDDHREALAPYLESGLVVLYDWPSKWPWAMVQSIEHCLEHHRDDARWIAFMDVDEFLFSPTGRPLTEILPEFEPFPGVVVNDAIFGFSGHKTKPPGLQIENFNIRAADELNTAIHSIVDPKRVDMSRRPHGPHHFTYIEGFPVTENKEEVTTTEMSRGDPVSFDLLRINHYWTRSEEECRAKFDRWATTAAGKQRPWVMFERLASRCNTDRDDTIKMYLPALREALARVEQKTGS
jgi:hypothetical protein